MLDRTIAFIDLARGERNAAAAIRETATANRCCRARCGVEVQLTEMVAAQVLLLGLTHRHHGLDVRSAASITAVTLSRAMSMAVAATMTVSAVS